MSDTKWFHETLLATSHKRIQPTADVLDALKQDYPIEASVADLIDNSIDAGATTILIRLFRRASRIVSLCIADDGRGMTDEEIDLAMQFAARRKYSSKDLGMFGLGLKTASLSQANSVTVLSRSKGQDAVGRRWSEAGIKKADWRCDVISPAAARGELDLAWGPLGKIRIGTVVRWDNVHDFDRLPDDEGDKYVGDLRRVIPNHIGLKLHRFLAKKKVRIVLDEIDVENGELGLETIIDALDPFPPESGRRGYPKTFHVSIPEHGELDIKAHIWPKKSSERGFKLESGRLAEHQGFYFFRHNRLVQDGGWNQLRAGAEPHLSLARVEVDIPESMSGYLRVHSTKRGVDVPRTFISAVQAAKAKDGTTFGDYLAASEEVYRTRGEQKERPILRPGKGIPAAVGDALEREEVPFMRGHGMSLRWGRVTGKEFFTIDRDTDEVVLNERYRDALLAGRKAGGADLPVVRTLLYFLLAPTLERERDSVAERGRINAIQAALMAAARLEGEK